MEHIGSDERTPRRNRCSEIVPRDQRDVVIPKSRNETKGIPNRVQNPEGGEIAIVIGIPAGGTAVAPLIRRHDMKPGRGERQHHLSPGIGELRKAVEEQDQRPARRPVAGLQQVHVQAIDVPHEAGIDTGRKRSTFQGRDISHARLLPDGSATQPSGKRRE
jgi:hypothetical protein